MSHRYIRITLHAMSARLKHQVALVLGHTCLHARLPTLVSGSTKTLNSLLFRHDMAYTKNTWIQLLQFFLFYLFGISVRVSGTYMFVLQFVSGSVSIHTIKKIMVTTIIFKMVS